MSSANVVKSVFDPNPSLPNMPNAPRRKPTISRVEALFGDLIANSIKGLVITASDPA
ncbi:hypothetical protein D9M71_698810 [compost metagenome]